MAIFLPVPRNRQMFELIFSHALQYKDDTVLSAIIIAFIIVLVVIVFPAVGALVQKKKF